MASHGQRASEHDSRGSRIACRCGALKGFVSSAFVVNHAICYCRDCQAFAHYLGSPDCILDRDGGTGIVQVRPAAVSLSEGVENLACIQLRPQGLYRWYTSCCRTPVGNTLKGKHPSFVGLIHSCLQDRPLERAFGPVTCRVNTRSARHPGIKATGVMPAVFRILLIAVAGVVHKSDSPFFSADGRPVCKPRVLGAGELEAIHRSVGPNAMD